MPAAVTKGPRSPAFPRICTTDGPAGPTRRSTIETWKKPKPNHQSSVPVIERTGISQAALAAAIERYERSRSDNRRYERKEARQ